MEQHHDISSLNLTTKKPNKKVAFTKILHVNWKGYVENEKFFYVKKSFNFVPPFSGISEKDLEKFIQDNSDIRVVVRWDTYKG